jgi:hypothetical protein
LLTLLRPFIIAAAAYVGAEQASERTLVILQNIFEEWAPLLQNYAPFNPHAVINLRCFHPLVIGNPSVRNSKQNIARSPTRILSQSL